MNIDELADILERGGAKIDRTTFPTLMQSPEYAEKVRSLLESGGATVPDSSAFYQKFTPQAKPVVPVAPKAAPGWGEVFFPTLSPVLRKQGMSILSQSPSSAPAGLDAVTGAASRGADVREQIWPLVRDMLTMPLRAAAGGSAAIGQTIGGADGVGGLLRGIGLRRPDVELAYKTTMADPQAEAVAMDANVPVGLRYSANPSLFSGIANDPTTLPLIAAGKLPIGGLAQGLLASSAMYGVRQLDEQSEGRGGYAPTGLEVRNSLAPTIGEAIPTALGVIPVAGKGLMGFGNTLFRRMVKPAKGGEVAGLNKALAMGLLPKLAGWKRTVGEAGENFLENLHADAAGLQPIKDAADAAGAKISTAEAAAAGDAAIDALRESAANLGLSNWGAQTKAWGRDILQQPQGKVEWDLLDKGFRQPSRDVPFSKGHNLKSGLYPIAYGKEAEGIASRNFRSEYAGAAARNLKEQLEAASPAYAEAMDRLAPLYGAEKAMKRAADTRGNNYGFGGLDVLGGGIPILLRTPAVAQTVWNAGRILNRAPQITPQMANLMRGIISTGMSLPIGTQQADSLSGQ